MNKKNISTAFFLLASFFVQAQPEKPPVLLPSEVKVKVKGIVCSFCAYGAEKSLSKLTFVDKKKFSSKGVLVDISKQMVSLAIEKGKKVKLKSIMEAIEEGGYEVVEFYLNIEGKILESQEKFFLKSSENSQLFELQGKNLAALKNKKNHRLIVSIKSEKVSSLEQGKAIPVGVLEVKKKT